MVDNRPYVTRDRPHRSQLPRWLTISQLFREVERVTGMSQTVSVYDLTPCRHKIQSLNTIPVLTFQRRLGVRSSRDTRRAGAGRSVGRLQETHSGRRHLFCAWDGRSPHVKSTPRSVHVRTCLKCADGGTPQSDTGLDRPTPVSISPYSCLRLCRLGPSTPHLHRSRFGPKPLGSFGTTPPPKPARTKRRGRSQRTLRCTVELHLAPSLKF